MHIICDLLGWLSGSIMFALMFLTLFSQNFHAHIDVHLAINKVLPPTWARGIKNWNFYQLHLHRLAKHVSQPPSYL